MSVTEPGGPDERDEEIAQLKHRIERERQSRQQAEDISEQATARLYSALQRVEEEHAGLRALAAAATHDIKNPLASISGFVSLLQSDKLPDDARAEVLTRLAGSARYTGQLIDGLLEVLGAGIQEDPAEPLDLDELMEDVAAALQARHPKVRVTHGPLGRVMIAAVDARRLFDNLMENAARHAGVDQVEISVSIVDRDQTLVTVMVADNGHGVADDDRERIFGIFQRGRDSTTGSGSGVGLAVSQRLAATNGGTLWLSEEPAPQGGAAFLVQLPRPAAETGPTRSEG